MKQTLSLIFCIFIMISCKEDMPVEKILESIELTQDPAKKNYNLGEEFDVTGMIVTAVYSDNSKEPITVTTAMLSYDFTTPGSGKTVTITYEGKSISVTGITVNAPDLIPTITDFAPTEARHGTTITISGTNFSTTKDDNIVTFNSIAAVVESATATELKVIVPKNMQCSGLIRITVSGNTIASANSFTYVPTYTVTTFPGSTQIASPACLAVDASGNVYVADQGSHYIRKITAAGVISIVAGIGDVGHFADGSVESATFRYPYGLVLDASGNTIYVTSDQRIRKIEGGMVTTLAGEGTQGFADGTGSEAKFAGPAGLAVDASGVIYVADAGNHRIRKVTLGGAVTTIAGSTPGLTNGTGAAAQFEFPFDVVVDATGNLYVSDSYNYCIRKITTAGAVTIFAGSDSKLTGSADGTGTEARFDTPDWLTIDAAGNLYVADRGNRRIRKITPAGVVSTIAGSTVGFADGPGTTAQFTLPTSMALDKDGNLYVSDFNRIRKITAE